MRTGYRNTCIIIIVRNFVFRAVGYHVHCEEYRDRLEESIRYTVEKCDRLHGFLLMHSLGGGTGSGLGTATLKLLEDNYPRVERCGAVFSRVLIESVELGRLCNITCKETNIEDHIFIMLTLQTCVLRVSSKCARCYNSTL